MSFTGVQTEFARIRAAAAALEEEACAAARRDVMALMTLLIEITPVNTGETVRNFTVAVGAPSRGVKTPVIASAEPTNRLSLGEEPNRGPNQSLAMADARAALGSFKKLRPIFLTNSVSQWGLIESGTAPGPPWNNRGAGGHTGLAMAYLRSTGRWK